MFPFAVLTSYVISQIQMENLTVILHTCPPHQKDFHHVPWQGIQKEADVAYKLLSQH